jgi:hypothetical protein
MPLFSVADNAVETLTAGSFQASYAERDIQMWADRHPALVNEGRPMLSLGCEISTHHGHAIDNLFLDADGCLVAAEMKRGKTPRDVVAQALDYAAYINGLGWPQVEALCLRRQGKALDDAFPALFGVKLVRGEKPKHRLLIVAESYDPRVYDAALYLINAGMRLALLQFSYFDLKGRSLLSLETTLGEIPIPAPVTATPSEDTGGASVDHGYDNWLLGSIAQALPGIAAAQHWPLRISVNKKSVTFASYDWPTTLGECQLRVDIFSRHRVVICLYFRKEAAADLRELIETRRDEWAGAFPAEFLASGSDSVTVTLAVQFSRPAMGDAAALDALTRAVEGMTKAMVPIVTDYFRR